MTATDRVLSAAPFGHLYGLYSFHLALAAGASTVLLPTFTPPDLARTLAAESVTVLFAAPAHVAACVGAGLLSADGLSSLRLAVMSGSAVLPAVAKSLQERMGGGHVTQLWGMTETQAGLYTRPGDPIETVAASAGRPSPGTEVRVVGPDGAVLPAEEEGELQVRGPLLFPRILRQPRGQPRRLRRRRLVSHRRSRRPGRGRKRLHHRTLQGRHQPGRRSSTTPATSRTCSQPTPGSTWPPSCRSRIRCWANAPAAASLSPATRRPRSKRSAPIWKRTGVARRSGGPNASRSSTAMPLDGDPQDHQGKAGRAAVGCPDDVGMTTTPSTDPEGGRERVHGSRREAFERRLRLWSGLLMAAFVVPHLSNHALGPGLHCSDGARRANGCRRSGVRP